MEDRKDRYGGWWRMKETDKMVQVRKARRRWWQIWLVRLRRAVLANRPRGRLRPLLVPSRSRPKHPKPAALDPFPHFPPTSPLWQCSLCWPTRRRLCTFSCSWESLFRLCSDSICHLSPSSRGQLILWLPHSIITIAIIAVWACQWRLRVRTRCSAPRLCQVEAVLTTTTTTWTLDGTHAYGR